MRKERILVVLIGNLGDAVLATAPLAMLRSHHHQAEITVLTLRSNARFFTKSPFVDRVDARWPQHNWIDRLKLVWSIRKDRYDMIYDLTNSAESDALFAALNPFPPNWSGGVHGCSHPHTDRGRLMLHRLDRHAAQLMTCGISPKDGYAPGVSPLPQLDWVESVVKDAHKLSPSHYGIQAPFAFLAPEGPPAEPMKRWPTERYGELALALLARGIHPVLVGGPGGVEQAIEIRSMAPGALDLVARLDIFQFIGLARQSCLAIGSEGDMAIIAAAAGAPTLAIINPNEASVRKAAPRGTATVGLVARNFDTIKVQDVLSAARAVAPTILEAQAS
ncbi:glycosyltransferase family 9 protein [Candidatus Phycosocius spiralis]|uniref:Glycosyl transferase n=1 Tax=Candidatus Phycosocius spiralis TaxID=2815099 RepID=A0ABQ4PXW8_9PROT|nr:glycosyltransferase family 9 protein [Candidatus Phycosocius spiralis]GIU67825.1 glycosyl transferase [Candidatus Phycosocius spiralis]